MAAHTHNRRFDLDFTFPKNNPFNIVLVEPEIPQNTGNIARLAAATDSNLHLVEPLGFRLNDKSVRRAGVDYWDEVNINRHPSFAHFLESGNVNKTNNIWLFSTLGERSHFDIDFTCGDSLIFGSESHGLSDDILEQFPKNIVQIPMINDNVRSLNLANSVSIALYEALRQYNLKK